MISSRSFFRLVVLNATIVTRHRFVTSCHTHVKHVIKKEGGVPVGKNAVPAFHVMMTPIYVKRRKVCLVVFDIRYKNEFFLDKLINTLSSLVLS